MNYSYRYRFAQGITMEDVRASMLLVLLCMDSLHGEARVRLDLRYVVDDANRNLIVDASTRLGKQANQLLIGFLRREWSPKHFHVKRDKPILEELCA